VYIAVVFEGRGFGKFEYDGSLEEFGGGSFIIEVFLAFSSGSMKDLNVSVTLCRTVALTSSVI
jgi:hypothetical protein